MVPRRFSLARNRQVEFAGYDVYQYLETKTSLGALPLSFYSRTEIIATFVIGMRGEATAQRDSDRIGRPTVGETGIIQTLKRATDK